MLSFMNPPFSPPSSRSSASSSAMHMLGAASEAASSSDRRAWKLDSSAAMEVTADVTFFCRSLSARGTIFCCSFSACIACAVLHFLSILQVNV